MVDASLVLTWAAAPTKYTYWYGTTGTRFSAQVCNSTGPGRHAWVIFHEDFRGAVWGGEAETAEAAKEAQTWLAVQAKPLAGTREAPDAEPDAAADTGGM